MTSNYSHIRELHLLRKAHEARAPSPTQVPAQGKSEERAHTRTRSAKAHLSEIGRDVREQRSGEVVDDRRPYRPDSGFRLGSLFRHQLEAARGRVRLLLAAAVAPATTQDRQARRDDTAIRELVVEVESGPQFGSIQNAARRKSAARRERRARSPTRPAPLSLRLRVRAPGTGSRRRIGKRR